MHSSMSMTPSPQSSNRVDHTCVEAASSATQQRVTKGFAQSDMLDSGRLRRQAPASMNRNNQTPPVDYEFCNIPAKLCSTLWLTALKHGVVSDPCLRCNTEVRGAKLTNVAVQSGV